MSRFEALLHYERGLSEGYRLLPFRFTRLGDGNYVLSNQAGEFTVLERQGVEDLIRHRLLPSDPAYAELKSKHFFLNQDSVVAPELLAIKLRTKLRLLASCTSQSIKKEKRHADIPGQSLH